VKLGDIVNDLLDLENASQVFVRKTKQENPMYTHTLTLMNDHNVMIKRVLYDERVDEIFKDNERNQQTKKTFNWNKVEAESLLHIHKDEMVRMINSGLQWTIDNHGVITKSLMGSASKRITTLLFNFLGTRVSFERKGRLKEYTDAHLYMDKPEEKNQDQGD
jgi:hypothetical protein